MSKSNKFYESILKSKKIKSFVRFILLHKLINIAVLLVLVMYLIHSYPLRYIGYSHIPEPDIILDERTWSYAGISIRQSGIPAGWSQLGAYKEHSLDNGTQELKIPVNVKGFNLEVDQEKPNFWTYYKEKKPLVLLQEMQLKNGIVNLPIVQPLVEQPPLGSVILSLMVPSNVSTFANLSADDFRKSSIWLGFISTFLIFLLGWVVSGKSWIGLIGAVVYSSAPTYLLLSRFNLLENVSTPFITASLICLLLSEKFKKVDANSVKITRALVVISGILAGLSALSKITGWSAVFTGIIVLWYWKGKVKEQLYFIFPAIIIGLSYFAWAFYLDFKLWTDIFLYQGIERSFIGSVNFLITMTRIGIKDFPLDGWWIGGFISLLLLSNKEKYLPLYVSFGVNLFLALFLGGANFPWYFIPLIPILCVATAVFFGELILQPKVIQLAIFFLVFFSSSFYWGYGVYKAAMSATHDTQPFNTYRLVFLGFVGLIFLSRFIKRKKLYQVSWAVFMSVVLYYVFVVWNERGFFYILANWGKLPAIYTPGTF